MSLPDLNAAETDLLQAMRTRLTEAIAVAGGSLPFDRYMEMALYEPGLGYYVNGSRKFGAGGDFVTAPEVSPLFSRCLARQVAQGLERLGGGVVCEVGAGSGRMAADLLAELEVLDALPLHYQILELSPSLIATQRETLRASVPQLLPRVQWLQQLPPAGFSGVVLGNELLDALPVHRFRRHAGAWQELTVGVDESGFHDRWVAPRSPGLGSRLDALWPADALPEEGYHSEINLRMPAWLRTIAARIERGYLLLIDYGYGRREYYHPDRREGTLLCHFRHRAFADPYQLPGLQDMTAHVDFSALALAGEQAGLCLAGYTTQAHFLIDTGLEYLLADSDPNDLRRHLQLMQGVKTLTLPGEMGERFKVMAFARAADAQLMGFRSRDLRDRL